MQPRHTAPSRNQLMLYTLMILMVIQDNLVEGKANVENGKVLTQDEIMKNLMKGKVHNTNLVECFSTGDDKRYIQYGHVLNEDCKQNDPNILLTRREHIGNEQDLIAMYQEKNINAIQNLKKISDLCLQTAQAQCQGNQKEAQFYHEATESLYQQTNQYQKDLKLIKQAQEQQKKYTQGNKRKEEKQQKRGGRGDL